MGEETHAGPTNRAGDCVSTSSPNEVGNAASIRLDVEPRDQGSALGRVTHGALALSLSSIVNIAGQLAIVPVAILRWGEARYGEWVVLLGAISVLKLADLGLQSYVVNRICGSYARNDRGEVHRVLQATLSLQLRIVIILLIAVGALVAYVPIGSLVRITSVTGAEVVWIILLLALEPLIGIPMGVVAGVYRATGRLARAANLGTVQQLALLISTLCLVFVRADFWVVAMARVGIAVSVSGWIVRDLRRLYPWLRLWRRGGSWRDGANLIGPALFFLLIPVADYISTQASLLVVQTSLAGTEVTRLSTHRTIVNLGLSLSSLLTAAFWPELTVLYGRGEMEKLVQFRATLTKLNMWLVGAVAFGVLPFLPWVYPLWTGGRLDLDVGTLTLLICRIVLWSIWSPSMTVLLAINRHRKLVIALIGSSLVSLSLCVVLVPVMGICGAALGALAGDMLIVGWLVPKLASVEIGDDPRRFAMDAGRALLWGVGLPFAFGASLWWLVPSASAKYLLIVPACACGAVVLMWTRLDMRERQLAMRLWHRRVMKIRFLR